MNPTESKTNSPDSLIPIPDQPHDLLGHLLPDEFAYPDIDFVEVPLQFNPKDGLKVRLTLNKLIVRFHATWEPYTKAVTCTAYMPGSSVRCFNLEFDPYLEGWGRVLAAAVVHPICDPQSYVDHARLIHALGGLFGRIVRKNLEEGNLADSSAS